jgi:hypothetical protein
MSDCMAMEFDGLNMCLLIYEQSFRLQICEQPLPDAFPRERRGERGEFFKSVCSRDLPGGSYGTRVGQKTRGDI